MSLKVERPDSNKLLRALIWGGPGQGKTTLLGSCQDDPRTSPTLILDMERGTDSLSGRDDIDILHVRGWDEINAAFNEVANGRTKYRSVCLDSLTEFQLFTLTDILHREAGNRRDKDLLTQQDYGKSLLLCRRLVREWKNLPCHVFFSARSKEELDPRQGMVRAPAFTGQFGEDVTAMVSVSAYLALSTDEKGATKRILLLQNQSQYRVKVRTPYGQVVPDMIESPTVGALLDVLQYKSQPEAA